MTEAYSNRLILRPRRFGSIVRFRFAMRQPGFCTASVRFEPSPDFSISFCVRSQRRIFCAGVKTRDALQRRFQPSVHSAAILKRQIHRSV